MSETTPVPESCEDPRPASAVDRLSTAIKSVDVAIDCLDLERVPWTPVEAERWERARGLLREIRKELEAARAAWMPPVNGR